MDLGTNEMKINRFGLRRISSGPISDANRGISVYILTIYAFYKLDKIRSNFKR